MEVGLNKIKYDYISERVYESAKNLLNKKLFPKYAEIYLKDAIMLK